MKRLIGILLSLLATCPALALERNVASQKLYVQEIDSATGAPKTGDAAQLTAYVAKDGGALTALGDTSATEYSSTNAPGVYWFDLTQAETNAVSCLFTGKSSTSGCYLIKQETYTTAANFSLAGIDSSGRGLLQTGTGTGQLDFTSGVVKSNVTQANGVAFQSIGGYPRTIPENARCWFVSTSGNDANAGTRAAPFLTWTAAISAAASGDHIYGDGSFATTSTITVNKTGLHLHGNGSSTKITMTTVTAFTPVITLAADDCSVDSMWLVCANRGQGVNAQVYNGERLQHLHIDARDDMVYLTGNNNICTDVWGTTHWDGLTFKDGGPGCLIENCNVVGDCTVPESEATADYHGLFLPGFSGTIRNTQVFMTKTGTSTRTVYGVLNSVGMDASACMLDGVSLIVAVSAGTGNAVGIGDGGLQSLVLGNRCFIEVAQAANNAKEYYGQFTDTDSRAQMLGTVEVSDAAVYSVASQWKVLDSQIGTTNTRALLALPAAAPAGTGGLGVMSSAGGVPADPSQVAPTSPTSGTTGESWYYGIQHFGRRNTAQTGTSTTITLDSGASAVDDAYKGHQIKISGGTGSGQFATITSYVGPTKVATIARLGGTGGWSTTPDNTSAFWIEPEPLSNGFALTTSGKTDVESALTSQGYTTSRAPKLDNLDAAVSSAGGGSANTVDNTKPVKARTTTLGTRSDGVVKAVPDLNWTIGGALPFWIDTAPYGGGENLTSVSGLTVDDGNVTITSSGVYGTLVVIWPNATSALSGHSYTISGIAHFGAAPVPFTQVLKVH